MNESTLPHSEKDGDSAIGVENGRMQYGSAAASGHTEIILPALPGSPTSEERLLARDFGPHVCSRIESAMKRNPYLKSGAMQSGPQVFAHYVACAKGANLLEPGALGRAQKLAKEFSEEGDQREYYQQVILPWLHSLTSEKRKP
jgi:hypothetical protein